MLNPEQLQILLDAFHLLQRFKKKAKTTHCVYGTAIHLLSNAMFMYDEAHIAELKTFLINAGALKKEDAKRLGWKYIKTHLPGSIPEKLTLTQRFTYAWAMIRELSDLFPLDPFVTQPLQTLFEEEIKTIQRGAVSDPTDGRPMHSLLPGGFIKRLRRIAGTSQLEGWHAVANKYMAAKNATPALSNPIFNERVGRWNVKSRIQNAGDVDFGMYRLDILGQFEPII